MTPPDVPPTAFDFETDVVQASRQQPVLVDFWAPWCGPCRVLGPTLDRLADEAGAQWRLVKVNTDEHPELMQRFGIRGIPAVKLFADGSVVAEFTGALPEPQVRRWLDEHLPSPGRARVDAAQAALADGDRQGAIASLDAALSDPDAEAATWAADARALLARLLVFDDPDRSRQLIGDVHTPESDAVRTVAEALDRDPGSLPAGAARESMATALAALQRGDADAAIPALTDAVQADRSYDDDGARKLAVALFLTLGDDDPAVQQHRRAFNMALY